MTSARSRTIRSEFGRSYPALGPRVERYRRLSRQHALSAAERREYADAIETSIRSLQRSELQRELPSFRPRCASGTWHTTGKEIEEAIRQQQLSALLACPGKVRRARTEVEWPQINEQAMKRKRSNRGEQIQ